MCSGRRFNTCDPATQNTTSSYNLSMICEWIYSFTHPNNYYNIFDIFIDWLALSLGPNFGSM